MNCSLWSFSRRDCELSVTFLLFFSFRVTCAMPRVVRTSHISIGSRLRALGWEQSQSFWHLGVMFTVLCRHPVFVGLFR